MIDFSASPPRIVDRIPKSRGILVLSDVHHLGTILNYGSPEVPAEVRIAMDETP